MLDLNVKPAPEVVAVKVAHVPPMYHVPPLMMQPEGLEEVVTWRVPLPEKGVPGAVVGEVPPGLVVVVVVGGMGVEVLGRYLMPVAGQEDLAPSVMGWCG